MPRATDCPPLPAALPQPEAAAGQGNKVKVVGDAKAKQEVAKKEQKLKAAAADYYAESVEERIDDPAMQEHVMNQMTSTQPQTATSAQPQSATPSKPPEY